MLPRRPCSRSGTCHAVDPRSRGKRFVCPAMMRVHDPAHVTSLTRLVTRMPGVFATIMGSVGNE